MSTLSRALAIGASILAVAAGCTSGDAGMEEATASPEQTEQTQQTQAPLSNVMTIWATEQVAESIEAVADQFHADTEIRVDVVIKEFGTMRQEVIEALSTNSGPDIFVGAHDWTGALVNSGAVAPLDQNSAYEGLRANALSAFSFDNALYGIPFGVENVALVCNSQLVPEQPANWEALTDVGFEIAMGRTAGDPYHMFYLQSSFGANIFGQNPDGSYLTDLAMAGEEGLAFANWLAENGDLFSFMDFGTVLSSMESEELACWITGPWAWPSLVDSLGEEKLAIYNLPAPGANQPRPFLDALGFFFSSSARDTFYANVLFQQYLASEAAQRDIYEISGRIPAHKAVIELASDNKKISGFARAGLDALPRPNIQEMDLVWSPLGNAQAAILTGQADPETAWRTMIEQIQSQIPVQ